MERLTCEETYQRLKDIGSRTLDILSGEGRKDFDAASFAEKEFSDSFLRPLPFGQYLTEAARNDTHRTHLLYVVAGAVDVFLKEGHQLTNNNREFNKFQAALNATATEADFDKEEMNRLCLCAALYHDLGKAIARERHPYEGYHLIHDLGSTQHIENGNSITLNEDFRNWLCAGMTRDTEIEYYRFFSKLMRYHDMWGNITTGEASIVMFSCTLDITESHVSGHKIFLGRLLLLNLADQFGTPSLFGEDNKPRHLNPDKLEHLLLHWNEVAAVLDRTKGYQEEARKGLMIHAEREGETVERLVALMGAAVIEVVKSQIQQTLRAECGGRFHFFCKDFGVVRLSYALRFFRKLGKLAKQEKLAPDRQAALIIRILKRIVETYESLIRANREQGRETGIEMSWLTRSEPVRDSIIQSLLGNSPEALSWIDDEISAFPCG
jgi:hypothetical protein